MLEILRSLPQGVYWYPIVAAFLVVAIRTLLGVAEPRPSTQATVTGRTTIIAGYADLVRRARHSPFAEADLERLCMGMLLQANGYRRYTVDACRRYLANEAPADLVQIIREHLGDLPSTHRPGVGPLPGRAELIVREIERITEAVHGCDYTGT